MKQYYIFINDERKGPLSFEEIKQENISNDTLVWFEGIPEWNKAHEIEELKELLKATPPPISTFSQIPPLPNNERPSISEEEEESSTILGLNKKVFYGIAVVVIIGSIGFYNYQDNESQRIEQINNTTETHNEQLESQQKEIDEQQARIAEQEQIEVQRRKEAMDRRLVEIENLLVQNQQAFEDAKRHLNDVTGFKLLRTSSERNEQITAAQNKIDFYKEEIQKLETEFEQINPNK
jgi:hypothetical protein